MTKKALKTKHFRYLKNHIIQSGILRKATKDKYLKIFTLLYYTGARINEIISLENKALKDIVKYGKFMMETTKTKRFKDGEYRKVQFSKKAVEDIKDIFSKNLRYFDDGYIFGAWNKKSKKPNISSLTTQLNVYLKLAFGDDMYTTHSFRRGYITEMILDLDINPKVVQKAVGHKCFATTQIYLEPSEEDISDALEKAR